MQLRPIPESKVLPPGLPPGVVPPGVVPPGVVHRERSRSRDAVRVPAKARQESGQRLLEDTFFGFPGG